MSFSVTSYNVLADSYLRPEWYPATPEFVLAPSWRQPALIRHIAGLAADVICLQEIESNLFVALSDHLRALGYEGHQAPKHGKPDGCATFVRTAALAVRAVHLLRYADGHGLSADSGHVALILLLEHEGRVVGIANTHLKWDAPGTPLEGRWGYRQITQLLAELPALDPTCPSWIVGGDFNATPGSEVVHALKQAGFVDAYRDRNHPATCNSNRRAKRIDYLFHTTDLTAEPDDLPIINDRTPLPSPEQPSDHLAVVARFDWSEPPSSPGQV